MKILRLIDERWTIYGACDTKGHCFLEGWLGSLAPNQEKYRDGLLAQLERIATDPQGPRSLPIEQSHQIDGPIYQLTKGPLRVLYFYDRNRVIICSHGFLKTTGKTPPGEIERAHATHVAYFAAVQRRKVQILGDDDDQ